MKYVEKHYGQGEGKGKKILNPKTIINVEENGIVELEMVQIRGSIIQIELQRFDYKKCPPYNNRKTFNGFKPRCGF